MEKNNPLVSICMPAYNAGKYISEAIGSIIDQSYQNWELIVVNDGSTDDTAEYLSYIKDRRIHVYHQQNKGQCAAANKAFSLSTGSLIKFMDADDIISLDFIWNQVELLDGRDDVIASAAWGRFYNNDINTFIADHSFIVDDKAPIDWLVTSLNQKDAMMQCAIWLIPRSILKSSGLWDESLNLINDFEFFIRVILHARLISFADNAILYYRSGLTGSLSTLRSRAGAESAFHSIDKGTSYILNHENSERTRKIVADCFQNYIYAFYPDHHDLLKSAEAKVELFGGSDARFPAGGYTNLLQKVIGWKLTKKIRMLIKYPHRRTEKINV